MGKKKGKGIKGLASAALDFAPGGSALKRGAKIAKGAGKLIGLGKGKGGGYRRRRRMTPQRAARMIFDAKVKAKIQRTKMSAWKGLI